MWATVRLCCCTRQLTFLFGLLSLFHNNELLGRQKRHRSGTCLFQPPKATGGHPFPPLIPCSFDTSHPWGLFSRFFASSDQPSPVADTKISIRCPFRGWHAGWPNSLALYIGLRLPCPEQPTNHSTRSTQRGEAGWRFPVGPCAWLESTQLPCQYPPAHQVIQYTCALWVHVPPRVSADQHALMGFLGGYEGTEEGMKKEWDA